MKAFWLHPGVAVQVQPAITWTCHICGDERPDRLIAVHTTDLSTEFGFQPGTLQQNVRYCTDRPSCAEAAKTLRLVNPPEATR